MLAVLMLMGVCVIVIQVMSALPRMAVVLRYRAFPLQPQVIPAQMETSTASTGAVLLVLLGVAPAIVPLVILAQTV